MVLVKPISITFGASLTLMVSVLFAASGVALCTGAAALLGDGAGEQARRARYVEVLSGVFRDTPVLPVDAIASTYAQHI